MCQSTSAVPVAHARAVKSVIRVIPIHEHWSRLCPPYTVHAYIIIYMYRRVYIIISGIIHAGNEVSCNTRGAAATIDVGRIVYI